VRVARAIATRASRRAFAARPVERAALARLLGAARWAPSSGNRQPWRFIVVGREAASRAAVEAALDPGNAWATTAPVLLVIAARPEDGSRVATPPARRLRRTVPARPKVCGDGDARRFPAV
jgi:nitroreductase